MGKKGKVLNSVKTRARVRPKKAVRNNENVPDLPIKRTAPKRGPKGYDAKKYTGAIPGLAERMKEYLKTIRDDR